MNVEKMDRATILKNLDKIGLLQNNSIVPLSTFKNRCSIVKYGKQGRNQLKVVFAGIPKEALFGFYVECNPDPLCMKQAYEWYVKLVKETIDFDDVDLHFGNQGIPISYGYPRYME